MRQDFINLRQRSLEETIYPDSECSVGNIRAELYCQNPGRAFELPSFRSHWVVMPLVGLDQQVLLCDPEGVKQADFIGLVPGSFSYLAPGAMLSWELSQSPPAIHFLLPDSLFISILKKMKKPVYLLDELPQLFNQQWPHVLEIAKSFFYAMEREIEAAPSLLRQFSQAIVREIIQVYFDQQVRHLEDSRSYLDWTSFAKLRSFIWLNLNRSISLDEMSEIVSLSKYHFIRMFQRIAGVTPGEYIKRQRVLKARVSLLVQQTGTTLAEIAEQCGYSDQSHMSRNFRKYLDMTPQQYLQCQG